MARRLATRVALVLLVAGAGGLALLGLYRGGHVRFNAPSPTRFPHQGIDVSHHQGRIDWPAVAASGTAFAYIKATEGRDFRDRRFEENWREAAAAGIPRGAYHFFTFCSPGLEQARHFLAVVPPEPEALIPVADVEFGGNCTSYEDLETVRRELLVFLEAVEAAWGRKPMLYLTVRSMVQIADDRFDAYPVWFRNIFWRLPDDAASLWVGGSPNHVKDGIQPLTGVVETFWSP